MVDESKTYFWLGWRDISRPASSSVRSQKKIPAVPSFASLTTPNPIRFSEENLGFKSLVSSMKKRAQKDSSFHGWDRGMNASMVDYSFRIFHHRLNFVQIKDLTKFEPWVKSQAIHGHAKSPPKGELLAWLGWRDSNPRMPGPKPGALPLGDIPLLPP